MRVTAKTPEDGHIQTSLRQIFLMPNGAPNDNVLEYLQGELERIRQLAENPELPPATLGAYQGIASWLRTFLDMALPPMMNPAGKKK